MKKQVLSIVLASTLLVGTTPTLTAHAGQWSNQNGKWYYLYKILLTSKIRQKHMRKNISSQL